MVASVGPAGGGNHVMSSGVNGMVICFDVGMSEEE
jgi:hypothetical protein